MEGMVVDNNFSIYEMQRITDIPPIDIHSNEDNADGVGEPGMPPFAPALTNAIFDLTGERIRELPFGLGEV